MVFLSISYLYAASPTCTLSLHIKTIVIVQTSANGSRNLSKKEPILKKETAIPCLEHS